jgi:uncharacterized membrane protein YeaQ/YmgE (transglycosylase-associated protein family)
MTKNTGARYEIAVDGTTRTHRDRKDMGIEASKKGSNRSIWLGILIGSTIGGFIPELWDAGLFSYSSVLLSGAGAFVGLWVGFKMS